MPLTNIQIAPGFNKQVTETGAKGQWTDGDFVRFRYGLPEKIGGFHRANNIHKIKTSNSRSIRP